MSSCQRAKPFIRLVFWFPPRCRAYARPRCFFPPGSRFTLSGPAPHALRQTSFGSRFGFALLTKKQRGRAHESATKPSPPHGEPALGTLGTDNGGGTGSTCPSLQGRDCLSASRFRREHCFTQPPLSARRRPPEADSCPQRYPSPSESKMPPVGIFARLARGSVDPGVAAPCRRRFPGLSAGRRAGDCSFMMLFHQVFYDCHWRVYTDKT